MLAEHGLKSHELVSSWPQAREARPGALPLAVIALEHGFETDDLAIIGEQDILGDRLARAPKRRRRAQDVLAEAAALSAGDLVVHIDHGVGRFVGLKTIEAAGAPHDCLEIHYAGGDRLFLPVENLELLSRYGSEQGELDRLGASGWQTRKSRLKKRVREMAGELIRIAAQRMTRSAPRLIPPEGLYDEFCARFPYRRNAGSGGGDRGDARRSRRRPADGSAGVRRRRLRQDRGGAARRLLRRDQRQADGDRRADDAARPPARQDLHQALRRPAGPHRPSVAHGRRRRTARNQEGRRRRVASTSSSARTRVLGKTVVVQGPRPGRDRRGAAFRRRPQGAAEGAARRGARADPVGDADPAHAATGDERRARTVDHRHAAGRPAGGALVRLAVRRADRARGAAARALSRRPVVLRLPAHRGSRRGGGVPAPERAGGEIRRRPRPDGGERARGQDRRLLRRQVRHPAVDLDRRIGPRHPDAPTR